MADGHGKEESQIPKTTEYKTLSYFIGGITLGSGCSGGIRNIFAENCNLDSTNLNTAIRVKNNAIRGGRLENFNVRNIDVGLVAQQVLHGRFISLSGIIDNKRLPTLR